jgi:hypothetical protein
MLLQQRLNFGFEKPHLFGAERWLIAGLLTSGLPISGLPISGLPISGLPISGLPISGLGRGRSGRRLLRSGRFLFSDSREYGLGEWEKT